MDTPRCLIQGRGGVGVFICDAENRRVLFLEGATNSGVRVVVSRTLDGPKRPFRLCYDDAEGLLFVGEQLVPRISIFSVSTN